jgi:hypothetical protein
MSAEPEVEAAGPEPDYEEIPSDELVAALAAGGALTFEPDLDEDDLLPGARPAAPVEVAPVSEATPDEIAAELAREAEEAAASRSAAG